MIKRDLKKQSLAVLGFELRALGLMGKCSTAWELVQALTHLVSNNTGQFEKKHTNIEKSKGIFKLISNNRWHNNISKNVKHFY
jgi:hypothetical protein